MLEEEIICNNEKQPSHKKKPKPRFRSRRKKRDQKLGKSGTWINGKKSFEICFRFFQLRRRLQLPNRLGVESAASDRAQSHRKRRNFRTTRSWNLRASYILIWTWVLSVMNCIYLEIVQGSVILIFRWLVLYWLKFWVYSEFSIVTMSHITSFCILITTERWNFLLKYRENDTKMLKLISKIFKIFCGASLPAEFILKKFEYRVSPWRWGSSSVLREGGLL